MDVELKIQKQLIEYVNAKAAFKEAKERLARADSEAARILHGAYKKRSMLFDGALYTAVPHGVADVGDQTKWRLAVTVSDIVVIPRKEKS